MYAFRVALGFGDLEPHFENLPLVGKPLETWSCGVLGTRCKNRSWKPVPNRGWDIHTMPCLDLLREIRFCFNAP